MRQPRSRGLPGAVALLDVQKLEKLGNEATYYLSDYQVVVWQPLWLANAFMPDNSDV